MLTLNPGDTVAFSRAVIRRASFGADARLVADARGVVIGVRNSIARVDWRGTWLPHEDGCTIRSLPAANLVRVIDGAVMED